MQNKRAKIAKVIENGAGGDTSPQNAKLGKAAADAALWSAINNKSIRAAQDAVAKQLTRREAKRKRGRDATIITSGTDIQSRTLLG